ncbi:T9SS type A sorting domain-containing protein [bacterium SCSIO 12741]|nr:T9SS type A sorting domain-containing protein [bacterium SCSIO 12741]
MKQVTNPILGFLGILLVGGFLSSDLNAQTEVKLIQYGRYDSIEVSNSHGVMQMPWLGGMETPQFSPFNLNGDSLMDLVFFDRDVFLPRTLINTGLPGDDAYRHAPEYEAAFPKMWDFALFRDYDHDGKHDIFTASDVGDFRVFKNESSTFDPDSMDFMGQLFPAHWDSNFMYKNLTARYYVNGLSKPYFYTNVFCGSPDIPAIVDADNDGDLDIMAFDTPNFQYWRNMQVEWGSSKPLDFMLYDICWGQLREGSIGFNLDLHSCFGMIPPAAPGGRHAPTKTILLEDMDCNGLPDLMIGDQGFPNMIVGYNFGNVDTAIVTQQDTSYPSKDVPVELHSFPAAYTFDADNDGLRDLVIAPNDIEGYLNTEQVLLYKNEGDSSCPDYKYQFDPLFERDVIDLGRNAYPVFFNVDGDSLMDIVCGGYGVYQPSLGTFDSRLAYYKNVGTTTSPEFKFITRDLIPTPNPIDTGLYPAFGDLDNDGDQDLLLATAQGYLHYYENQAASAQDSAEFVRTSVSYNGKSFGRNPRLYLYDVNDDGKLDILLGDKGNTIRYYNNTGTAQVADFSPTSVDSTFGNISLADQWGHGNLTVVIKDMDTNGVESNDPNDTSIKRFMFVSAGSGWMYLYDQFSSTRGASFRLLDSLYIYTRHPSIHMEDLTGDGKPDMIFGHRAGGMSILLKDGGNIIRPPEIDTTSVEEISANQTTLKLYPNPGIDELFFHNPDGEIILSMEMLDMTGKQVHQMDYPGNGPVVVSNLPSGSYIVRIQTDKELISLPYFKSDQ